MRLETESTPQTLVVRVLEDRLDAAVAVQFKDAIRDLACDAPDRVILDLGEVMFLDSSGLGAIIGAMKLLAPRSQLELARLNPAVIKVFTLTHMDRVLTIHTDLPFIPPVPVEDRLHAR